MMDNDHWKGFRDWDVLEKFLQANPDVFVYESRNKESRYTLRKHSGAGGFVDTVDGRCLRRNWHTLTRQNSEGARSVPMAERREKGGKP